MTKPAAVYHRSASSSSTSSDEWCTPESVLERVRQVGDIMLDPCTSKENPVGAESIFTIDDDGLAATWEFGGLVFVNPPYSQAKLWAAKIAEEAIACEIVSLVAARPDTAWFRELCWDSADAVCFWRGRITFVGAPNPAPFPSCLTYHGPRVRRFERAFADAGKVIRL